MKELNKSFVGIGEVRGFEFTQLKKTKLAYLYQVKTSKSTMHYEVFKHKVNNKYQCVSYPRSKSFGLWAWSYNSLELAQDKFNEINEV